jgi:hypothetical protein
MILDQVSIEVAPFIPAVLPVDYSGAFPPHFLGWLATFKAIFS